MDLRNVTLPENIKGNLFVTQTALEGVTLPPDLVTGSIEYISGESVNEDVSGSDWEWGTISLPEEEDM